MLRSYIGISSSRHVAHAKWGCTSPSQTTGRLTLLDDSKLGGVQVLLRLLLQFCFMPSDKIDNLRNLLVPLPAIWTLPGHHFA